MEAITAVEERGEMSKGLGEVRCLGTISDLRQKGEKQPCT
jgi:hypothetical protein